MSINTVLMIIQVLSALSIIVLVLLQQGKGADMGSAFGTGSAGSLFGASGAANFLSRSTKWAAVVFFVSTAGLAYVTHSLHIGNAGGNVESGVMQNYQDRSVPQVPGGAAPSSVPGAGSVPAAPATPPAADPSVPKAPAETPAAPASPAAPAK
ncbi:preprotein translocase subunit SecG [Bordetella genomosp. 13]|uniref:preprotein translocase subunit SecG n=1 Tax=Bordetella genomosp. 13 TaxID=463040 RepID=UPI0011A66988|nr:preprotein translocase subunit SecG [Bordetella genomosp. 13]